jgi:hypothetical protein
VKGDVLLLSQDDVNLFVDRHRNVNGLVIDGKLIIGSRENEVDASDIFDISGLSNIVEVTGKLQVGSNPELTTTAGLQNIRGVGGLNINRNNNLTSFTFNSLKTVHDQFVIYWNNSINSLDGFSALASVGSYFSIEMNESLATLKGLGALDTLYSVEITDNPALVDISALASLVRVGNDVLIDGNNSLVTLNGLEKLQYVGADFSLDKGCLMCGNEKLKDIQVSSLAFIGGDCRLSNNTNAEVIDFPGLIEIKGTLDLNGFNKLSHFAGFGGLLKIGGDLSIRSNEVLSDLDGFSKLDSLGGYLRIYANPSLATMNFASLTSVNLISVFSNPRITSFNGFFNSQIIINTGVEISWNSGLNDFCSLRPLVDRARASGVNALIDIVNNGDHNDGEYTNDYSWIKANCY